MAERKSGIVVDESLDEETKISVIKCRILDKDGFEIDSIDFPRSATPREIAGRLKQDGMDLLYNGGREISAEGILQLTRILFEASRKVPG